MLPLLFLEASMQDFRRFPGGSSRQLISYTRFMSLTGNKIFLCLDKGVIEIAKYLLNTRGLWRTTYVKEYVGTIGYNMPTEEEFENVINAIGEANIDMASCQEIVDALEGIASAIGNQNASSSSASGCGCVVDPGTDITDVGDGAGVDIPAGENFPPGFSDRPEYDEYKCKAAHYLVDRYVQTLRNWASLFGMAGGLTIAVISGLLLLSVPPLALVLILAALGTLVGIDIALLSELNNIAQCVEDDSQLICEILATTTSAEAAQAIRNSASDVIDGLTLTLPATYKVITSNLISNNQADIIVNKDPEVDAMPPQDCSGCTSGDCALDVYDPFNVGDGGSIDVQAGGHVIATPIFNAGRWSINIRATAPGNENEPRCWMIDNVVVGNASHVFYSDFFVCFLYGQRCH